jgi:hypothetical protein
VVLGGHRPRGCHLARLPDAVAAREVR